MKMHLDFVTNSSSTSYLVGVRGEVTEEKVASAICVKEGDPLYPLVSGITRFLLREQGDAFNRLEGWLKDEGFDSIEAAEMTGEFSVEIALVRKGFDVFLAYASYNEYDGFAESFLGNYDLNCETEDLVIRSKR